MTMNESPDPGKTDPGGGMKPKAVSNAAAALAVLQQDKLRRSHSRLAYARSRRSYAGTGYAA